MKPAPIPHYTRHVLVALGRPSVKSCADGSLRVTFAKGTRPEGDDVAPVLGLLGRMGLAEIVQGELRRWHRRVRESVRRTGTKRARRGN